MKRTTITKSFLAALVGCVLAIVSTTQAQADTYFFHNDHLGTPQAVTDASQQVVWQAEYNPFGEVTETTHLIEQNLRFPGQYFDSETELHYNYFRYYDASIGKYISSDPIGLRGGLSTYGYAYQNPNNYFDPDGRLVWFGIPAAYWGAGAAGAAATLWWAQNNPWAPRSNDAEQLPSFPNWYNNEDASEDPPGTEWAGAPNSSPGDGRGNYHNPVTGESYRPDLNHPDPIGPHWDYHGPNGETGRFFPDGTYQPK